LRNAARTKTPQARAGQARPFYIGQYRWRPPKGSRPKLGEAFVNEIYVQWQAHGRAAVEWVIEEDPLGFLRLVAGLVPRQVEVSSTNPLEQLSDGELSVLNDVVNALVGGRPDAVSDADTAGGSLATH
jgi:hypothetical protein